MEYISSDTNVWIDFLMISQIELPFLLPYTYLMNRDAIEDELLSPQGFREKLIQCGLRSTEITEREFYLAEEYGERYLRLSIHDRIALAIAKERNIILLTGDGALRKAAQSEKVQVMGTLGILDALLERRLINIQRYGECLTELQRFNGREVRLPRGEIEKRIQFSAVQQKKK